MMNEVPALAASTPYAAEDGVFGFETPSPKSSRSSVEVPKATAEADVLLPHHYGGQEFYTPAEKIGTALRRFQLRFFSSPFYSPRRLEDRFTDGKLRSRFENGKGWVALALLIILGGSWVWSRSMSSSISNDVFAFRPIPVKNSPSHKAMNLFRQSFKTNESGWIGMDDPLNPGTIFCLLDQAPERDDVMIATDTETKDFALGFETYLLEHLTTLLHRMGHKDLKQTPLVNVRSYFSLQATLPHIAESKYATPDGRTILVEIDFVVPPKDSNDYDSSVIDTIQRYGELHSPDYVDVTYTGLPLFQSETVAPSKDLRPLDTLLPSSQPSMIAYQRLASLFGPGRVSPYRIVFEASPEHDANNKEAFRIMHNVMEAFVVVDTEVAPKEEEIEEDLEMVMGMGMVNLDSVPQRTEDGNLQEHLGEVMDEMYGETGFKNKDAHGRDAFKSHHYRTSYDGAAFLRNNPVPYPLFVAAGLCLDHNKPHCPVELLHLFNHFAEHFTSHDDRTMYIKATLGFDPFSRDGIRWLKAAREKLRLLQDDGALEGFNVYLEGGASLEYDAAQEIFASRWLSWSMASKGIGLVLIGVVVKLYLLPVASRLLKGKGKAFKDV